MDLKEHLGLVLGMCDTRPRKYRGHFVEFDLPSSSPEVGFTEDGRNVTVHLTRHFAGAPLDILDDLMRCCVRYFHGASRTLYSKEVARFLMSDQCVDACRSISSPEPIGADVACDPVPRYPKRAFYLRGVKVMWRKEVNDPRYNPSVTVYPYHKYIFIDRYFQSQDMEVVDFLVHAGISRLLSWNYRMCRYEDDKLDRLLELHPRLEEMDRMFDEKGWCVYVI